MSEVDANVSGGRWLRGVSGVMAVFCGLVAVTLTLMVVVMLASTAITGWTAQPRSWQVGEGAASVSGHFDQKALKSCRPGEAALCPDPGPPKIKAYVSSLLGYVVLHAPLAALAYGLFQACACFVGLAKGQLLARRTIDRLVRFSVAGLIFVLLAPQAGRIAALVADGSRKLMDLVTGDRSVLFSFSSYSVSYAGVNGLLTMIYAVTLTVIAVVMVKASTIADDHAQIV